MIIPAARNARVVHRRWPSKDRGRRECRVQAAPMARLQQKTQAAVTTGSAKTSGIPCAMVLTLIRALLGDRALLPPSPRGLRRVGPVRADIASSARLDPSVGGSGPHDFAVRQDAFARARCALNIASVHCIPPPTSVTIASRPSAEGNGMRERQPYFSEKRKRDIFRERT